MNKNEFLTATKCMTMAWYQSHHTPPTRDQAAQFRMKQGREVAAYARQLSPEGFLVDGLTNQAVALTQRLVRTGTRTIFEATFQSDPFVAKADALKRNGDGWDVIEVKSSFSTSKKATTEYIDDLAYTVMVLRRAGINVKRSQLLLLSKDYRRGNPVRMLFNNVDKTHDVAVRAELFEQEADLIASAVHGNTIPQPELKHACRNCDFFKSNCVGSGIEHTVLELPQLHNKKFQVLCSKGIVDIADIPADFGLTPMHQRVRAAAESNRMFVAPGLSAELAAIQWPCHYLDFETVATTIPLYDGHPCHHQLLTQFSVHRRSNLDSMPQHDEFLADAAKDEERVLAERLIQVLGKHGDIVVYSHFEDVRIKGLVRRFGDLADPLNAIRQRLVDFAKIVRKHVYHPAFGGSFSLKKVVPALVPDISYDDLAIGDGGSAVAVFARLARNEIADVARARQDLLTYCKTDTFVMVRLHEELANLEPA